MSLIDDSLLRQETTPRVRPQNVLWVTDLTKPCLRSSFYGIVAKKPYDLEALRVFQAGNLLEEYWIRVLREHPDYEVLGTQMPAYYYFDDWEIHGRADILAQHKRGRLMVHEVKSTKSLYFIRKEGGPRQEHIAQVNYYAIMLGLSHGQIDYLDKSALLRGKSVIDASYIVEADSAGFSIFVERAVELAKSLSERSPPPAVKCWLCDYCLHREECRETGA